MKHMTIQKILHDVEKFLKFGILIYPDFLKIRENYVPSCVLKY